MSYPQSGGLYDFFVPYIPAGSASAGVMCEIDFSQSAGTAGEYLCVKPCTINLLQFTPCTLAVVGTTTAPTVVVKKRPTPLSSSGQTTIATLTVANGATVGQTTYKNVEVQIAVGQSIQVTWTQAVGGSVAGKGMFSLAAFDDDHSQNDNSSMVASST